MASYSLLVAIMHGAVLFTACCNEQVFSFIS